MRELRGISLPAGALMLLALPVLAGGGGAGTAPGTTPGAAPENTPAIPPARAAALERLVRQDCGSCHGMTLRGGLGPDIRATALAGRDPEGLAMVILDGIPDTPMPPWRPLLSEEEARWIARYLLGAGQPEEGERP